MWLYINFAEIFSKAKLQFFHGRLQKVKSFHWYLYTYIVWPGNDFSNLVYQPKNGHMCCWSYLTRISYNLWCLSSVCPSIFSKLLSKITIQEPTFDRIIVVYRYWLFLCNFSWVSGFRWLYGSIYLSYSNQVPYWTIEQ